MNRILGCFAFVLVGGFMLVQSAHAADSSALEAAKAAVAEPVATPAAAPAAETPTAAAEPAKTPEPVVSAPAATPTPTIEPTILKQLRDHTPIPIHSSLDQAIDTNNNRTLEYDEIKDYIKNVRAVISKSGRYPTNTDVLYHFDKNHDGYMDGGDVSALESYIH